MFGRRSVRIFRANELALGDLAYLFENGHGRCGERHPMLAAGLHPRRRGSDSVEIDLISTRNLSYQVVLLLTLAEVVAQLHECRDIAKRRIKDSGISRRMPGCPMFLIEEEFFNQIGSARVTQTRPTRCP